MLNLHCGNAGFGHLAPILAVITFDKKAFFQEHEEDAGFLHAELFSSGFILGLEAQGIQSCALNWHVDKQTDMIANQLLNLNDEIKIALLILIGYSNGKPEAYSYKEQDIFKIIDYNKTMKLTRPLEYIKHSYNGKIFPEAVMSGEGVSILFPSKAPAVDKMPFLNTLWDDKNFKNINLPMQTGILSENEKKYFSYPNDLRILDMPIKIAGSNQYKIPKEISQYLSIISKAACYEHAMNEKIEDYYCYITIDQKLVSQGSDTRKGGIHVDGFQGARIPEPLMLDHSYIVYDKFPTIFYNQEFEVFPSWDKTCHNYFEGFQTQAKKENQVTYSPYEILLINAYCLHEAPKAPKEEYRVFFRMSYTVREFDRLGNAHNPMFNYKWNMLPRNIQSTLVCPL